MRLTKPTHQLVPCHHCGAQVGAKCRGTGRNAHSDRVTDAYRLKAREDGRRAAATLTQARAAKLRAEYGQQAALAFETLVARALPVGDAPVETPGTAKERTDAYEKRPRAIAARAIASNPGERT